MWVWLLWMCEKVQAMVDRPLPSNLYLHFHTDITCLRDDDKQKLAYDTVIPVTLPPRCWRTQWKWSIMPWSCEPSRGWRKTSASLATSKERTLVSRWSHLWGQAWPDGLKIYLGPLCFYTAFPSVWFELGANVHYLVTIPDCCNLSGSGVPLNSL